MLISIKYVIIGLYINSLTKKLQFRKLFTRFYYNIACKIDREKNTY